MRLDSLKKGTVVFSRHSRERNAYPKHVAVLPGALHDFSSETLHLGTHHAVIRGLIPFNPNNLVFSCTQKVCLRKLSLPLVDFTCVALSVYSSLCRFLFSPHKDHSPIPKPSWAILGATSNSSHLKCFIY